MQTIQFPKKLNIEKKAVAHLDDQSITSINERNFGKPSATCTCCCPSWTIPPSYTCPTL